MDETLMPPADMPEASHADDSGTGNALTVRTMNLNMGAVRVANKRQIPAVMHQIEQLAQIFGGGWEYQIPFKNKRKGTTELVKGPTVGCAKAVARCYGNCTTGVSDVREVGNAWVFDGVFIDIESGFQLIRPFRQRKSANIGGYGGDQDRAEDIMFQIGASKATRNVVTNAIGDLVDRGVEMAKNALTARIAKNRPDVLERIRSRFEEYGIDEAKVRKFYHRSKLEDCSDAELAQVIKALQAVADGNVKPGELWGDEIPATVREEMRHGMAAETVSDAHDPAKSGTQGRARSVDQQQDRGDRTETAQQQDGGDQSARAESQGEEQTAEQASSDPGEQIDPDTGEVIGSTQPAQQRSGKKQRRTYRQITDDVIAMLADAEAEDDVDAIIADEVTGGVRSNTELMGEVEQAAQDARQRIAEATADRAGADDQQAPTGPADDDDNPPSLIPPA